MTHQSTKEIPVEAWQKVTGDSDQAAYLYWMCQEDLFEVSSSNVFATLIDMSVGKGYLVSPLSRIFSPYAISWRPVNGVTLGWTSRGWTISDTDPYDIAEGANYRNDTVGQLAYAAVDFSFGELLEALGKGTGGTGTVYLLIGSSNTTLYKLNALSSIGKHMFVALRDLHGIPRIMVAEGAWASGQKLVVYDFGVWRLIPRSSVDAYYADVLRAHANRDEP